MSATEFYTERDRLRADLDTAKLAFYASPTAETKEAFDAARNAYAAFRSGIRTLAYLGRAEGDPFRTDAERLVARGDFTPQEA